MNPKLCPICKKEEISDWESCCSNCWKKIEHRKELCDYLVIFNHVRETCRQCGFDPLESIPF